MEKLLQQLLEILNMRILFLLLLLLSFNVKANGLYVDVGIGHITDVPVDSNTTVEQNGKLITIIKQKVRVSVDADFVYLAAGYEYNNWHIEINRIGVLKDDIDSIKTIIMYKRIKF